MDFQVYFEGIKVLFSGQNPYVSLLTMPGPFNYPPTVFLFIAFFQNKVLFDLLSYLAFFLSVYLLTKRNLVTAGGLFLLFLISYFPFKFNNVMGQINNFILLFIVLAYYYHPFFLAYAIGIKLVTVIYLFYYFLTKDYKKILSVFLFVALLIVLSLFVVPLNFQKVHFTDVILRAFGDTGKEVYYNQSLAGLLSRSGLPFLLYPLSLLFLIMTWFKGRRLTPDKVFSAVTCLMLILNPIAWQHHFVIAVIPLIFLFKDDKLLVSLSYLLMAWNFKHPEIIPTDINVILSHQFLGVFLLWVLALFGKKTRTILLVIYAVFFLFIYLRFLLCKGNFCF